jgi:prepilin-type N-terminal cleavage/methylation domain-containing protein
MFIQVLRWFADKMSMKPVSVDAAGSRTCSKKKAGFTIVELMVVIIIVNLLSGVAVPKLTDMIERAKQRIDLMTLYLLRDAVNRHMYESDMFSVANAGDSTYAKNLSNWLTTDKGATLFIMELHSVMPANFQGRRNADQNVSELMYKGGFLKDIFEEAGMGAIGDIVDQRFAHPDSHASEIESNSRFVATTVSNGAKKDYVRTYPTKPVFISKALNHSSTNSGTNQYRVGFKLQWTNKDPNSHSIEIFIGKEQSTANEGQWKSAMLSCQGVCFSTYGSKGCQKSTCVR